MYLAGPIYCVGEHLKMTCQEERKADVKVPYLYENIGSNIIPHVAPPLLLWC